MKKSILLALVILISATKISAQLFSESAASLGVNFSAGFQGYGSGVSCFDWNNDGLDDLTFAGATGPRFYVNNGNGFDQVELGIVSSQEERSILWVDYDNDGDSDLFITRFFGQWSLYRNDGNNQFTNVTVSSGLLNPSVSATHGACWGDVNNDSWSDLYICNYSITSGVTNYFFLNNGNGTFTECAFIRGIDNGSKLSFQGVFFDANMDGWQDLYVINDKTYSNTLYLNNGDGFFTDISQSSQTDIVVDAMSNSIADYDNDGDLDIYISNIGENKLLVNNGDLTFSEMSTTAQLASNQFCWGAVWLDVNLDMLQDLFVATAPINNLTKENVLFTANANSYTLATNSGFVGLEDLTYCAASGDFNNDGLPDIALSKKGQDSVDVWLNNSSPGNFLKVALEATESNRDGIGSVIRCYSGGVQQLRYTFCGEQYMSQNSRYELFGLNGEAIVDSLSVTWLSGTHDVFYDISPNQTLVVVEGSSSVTVNTEDNSVKTSSASIYYSNGVPVLHSERLVDLSVFDQQGRLILAKSVLGKYGLNELSQGVYFLKIQSDNEELIIEKVVVTN